MLLCPEQLKLKIYNLNLQNKLLQVCQMFHKRRLELLQLVFQAQIKKKSVEICPICFIRSPICISFFQSENWLLKDSNFRFGKFSK
jgi:hypothetical protein